MAESIDRLELSPEQPAEVAVVIAEALAGPTLGSDPWWQAGLEEALEPSPARPRLDA